MSEWIWINGEIVAMAEARLGIEDRGFQFADGVYEVIKLYEGKPFTLEPHLERLDRSAAGIELKLPTSRAALAPEIAKLVARSGVRDGMVYLQLTRGVAPRNHLFPETQKPTLLFYARPMPSPQLPGEGEGVKLLALEDDRWKRCWIKSIALLPNVLAKNKAVAAGADEAVFIDNGIVTECSASNLFAVIGGKLVTHPVGSKVLPGITRAVLLDCAATLNIPVDERGFVEEEAIRASELFITSTTREVSWVARWNDRYIGQARCGPITLSLHKALRQKVVQEVGPLSR
ncbi:MAG TPA: D-amino acid aminotransferase [Tepidisphaeraceae bacterium]|nr:D-amino acid aminotransferase [Tepidisphaeraceae bacterium]